MWSVFVSTSAAHSLGECLPKEDVSTLGPELLSHGISTLVEDVLVPRSSNRNTSREDAGVVCYTDGQRTILKAEAREAETRDANNVANTRSRSASHHVGLLLDGELGREGLSLGQSIFPTTDASGIC